MRSSGFLPLETLAPGRLAFIVIDQMQFFLLSPLMKMQGRDLFEKQKGVCLSIEGMIRNPYDKSFLHPMNRKKIGYITKGFLQLPVN
jgi:hypothetical protein